jgi:hypothetical protein
MSFAATEVLRRNQYAADMVSCVLLIRNDAAHLCVGDKRAGYDLLARRGDWGKLPPYEEWQSKMLFAGDVNGRHTVLKTNDETTRAFVDLTFGQVAVVTRGAIQVPPAFAAFGALEWPALTMGGVSFQYAPTPEPPEMRHIDANDWSGLIDDLETLAGIALRCGNDEAIFVAEMQQQMRQLGR